MCEGCDALVVCGAGEEEQDEGTCAECEEDVPWSWAGKGGARGVVEGRVSEHFAGGRDGALVSVVHAGVGSCDQRMGKVDL